MIKLGIILLGVLAAWITFSVVTSGISYPKLSLLELGNGFEGGLALPKEKIDSAFETYRTRVISTADRASYFKLGGEVAGWLVFFCTAAITLVARWYGQAPQGNPAGAGAPVITGLPQKATRLVAMLAALSAVLTAAGGLASQQGQSLNSWARDRQHDFNQAREKLISKDITAGDAQAILDDLALSVRQ